MSRSVVRVIREIREEKSAPLAEFSEPARRMGAGCGGFYPRISALSAVSPVNRP